MTYTIEQIGQGVKRKYPGAYDHLSDTEVGQAFIAKHPEYNQVVEQPQTPPQAPEAADQQKERPGFFKSLLGPELSAVASGVRAIQSIPKVITGHADEALEIQKKPLFGVKTFPGMDTQELAGSAVQTAGQALTAAAPVTGFATQTLGSDITNKESFKQTATDVGLTIVAGKAIDMLAPYFGKTIAKIYEAAPQGVKNTLTEAAQTVSSQLRALGETINPYIDKVLPEALSTKSLPKIATDAAKNRIVKTLGPKAVADLEQTYTEIFTSTKSGNKLLTKSLSSGKAPSSFLASHGYVADVKDGKIVTQPLIERMKGDVQPYENILTALLRAKDAGAVAGDEVVLSDLASQAKRALNTPFNRASGTLSQQEQAIDNIIGELQKQYGPKVNRSTLNEIKQGQWFQSHAFDLSQPRFMPDVNYAIGNAAKNIIEDKVPEAGIRELNSYIGDYIDAMTVLRKIEGQVVKGGRLGKYFARTIGGVAGSGGGPLGTIAGMEAGNFIAEVVQSMSISNPAKRAILQSIPKSSPLYEAAQNALQQIVKDTVERSTPALPPSSTIFAGSRTVPESKMEVLPAKRAVGRNPKTGRMFRYYKSESQ